MYICTVKGNSRVMICTLSGAHWQQASNLLALRRFGLIWTDWDNRAYQYNTKQYTQNLLAGPLGSTRAS